MWEGSVPQTKRASLEVLAPAGSLEHVGVAIEAGADAIYLGIKGMSSRPDPWGFDTAGATEAAQMAHASGVRAYFALNAAYAEFQSDEVSTLLEELQGSACDALILGDWGLLKRVRDLSISLPIHASTLLGVYNAATIRVLQRLKVSRVIFSTNLFLDEMASLARAFPDMEFEVIAYGGACFNDSRRCELPHFVSADEYHVGCEFLYSSGSGHQGVSLHMPDIDISSTLALYVALGITSFKIEGRTRPARYISESIHAVRRGLDAIIERSTEPNLSHYVIHPADRGARK